MIPVDAQTMREVAPRFSGANAQRQEAIISAVGAVLAATLDVYEINTRLRIAHFLGQTCHESAGFRTTEEFADGSAYEGRQDLGNTQKGDGKRYKGRGILQLTGRANYKSYGAALGVDLEGNPSLAAEPALSLTIACEYWKRRGLNAMCDRDDLLAVTRAINGGTNGLEDRRQYTVKAKAAVARLVGLSRGVEPDPVLYRGSKGDAVERLQTALRAKGYQVAVDGDFGAGTEVAVYALQKVGGITADGIVGAATWGLLK